MTWIWIFLGGGLGSVARFGITKVSTSVYGGNFPLGTFVSNILACLILAVLVVFVLPKNASSEWMQPLLAVGFCGGFSTFSTFSNETVQLMQTGNTWVAVLNILFSVIVGVGLIFWIRTSESF